MKQHAKNQVKVFQGCHAASLKFLLAQGPILADIEIIFFRMINFDIKFNISQSYSINTDCAIVYHAVYVSAKYIVVFSSIYTFE